MVGILGTYCPLLFIRCSVVTIDPAMKRFALSILVLFGLFKYGSTIMCYECNSATNSQCNEKILPENLKRNCSENDKGIKHTLCRKIVQHVEYGIRGQLPYSRVIRSCGWDETKYKGVCYHCSGYGGRQEVCSCSSDYCNGGQDLTSSAITSFAIMMLQTILLRHLFCA